MLLKLVAMTMMVIGCVSTGTLTGVSDGGQAVHFNYEQGFLDNDGVLSITMPDGEVYSGKFVQHSSSRSGSDWEFGESSDDDALVFKDSTTVSSQAEALLLGNKGSNMECKFQFSSPDLGIEGGGIGRCKTSKDQKIAITF